MFYFLIVLSKECALLHVKRGREREREKKVDFRGFFTAEDPISTFTLPKTDKKDDAQQHFLCYHSIFTVKNK